MAPQATTKYTFPTVSQGLPSTGNVASPAAKIMIKGVATPKASAKSF